MRASHVRPLDAANPIFDCLGELSRPEQLTFFLARLSVRPRIFTDLVESGSWRVAAVTVGCRCVFKL